MNANNNLVGLQYDGISAGTFRNSFNERSYFLGVGRKVYEKKLAKDLNVDLEYKAGGIYGYGDKYPNISGVSPLVYPVIGVAYKVAGVDLTIIPSNKPIFAGNLKLMLPGPVK